MDDQHEELEGTDQSRREFATKLLAAAGAVAAAGLLGSANRADAAMDELKISSAMENASLFKLQQTGASMFKFYKSPNGFRVTLSGAQLGAALQNAGLVAPGANLENATLAIEFTT